MLTRKRRQGVISLAERDGAIRLLERQLITLDRAPEGADMIRIVTLAVTEGLSGHDAAYRDLALRLRAELGTLDRDLADAGERYGLTVHHT